MKDEWPIGMQSILYHGELLGFSNLYVLDGSEDPKSQAFLVYVRDQLGVNVIFSPTKLDGLSIEMSTLGQTIAGASDFIMKMDPDEFLGIIQTGNSTCRSRSTTAPTSSEDEANSNTNCSLTPYGMESFLSHPQRVLSLRKGGSLMFQHRRLSMPNEELCKAGKGDDIGLLRFLHSTGPDKALMDSRTLREVDLGGHFGTYFPPHDGPNSTSMTAGPLGFLHVHRRCLEHETNNIHEKLLLVMEFLTKHITVRGKI